MKTRILHISILSLMFIVASCNNKPIRVACVGDSITYGHGIEDREHNTYPAILDSLLGDRYMVANFGVSGTTMLRSGNMPYMSEQAYRDALSYNPDIVTIKLGTNDSKPYNWAHSDEFKADMLYLINSFRALPSNPKIWICLPVPAYGDAWNINDSIIVNSVIPLIKEVANEENLPIINLYEHLAGHKELFPDMIHPNEEGQRMIGEYIYKSIKR